MDYFEIYEHDNDLALKVIKAQMENFNNRIKGLAVAVRKDINIDDWKVVQFVNETAEIEKLLNKILILKIERKVEVTDMENEMTDKKFKMATCKFIFEGNVIASYGFKS